MRTAGTTKKQPPEYDSELWVAYRKNPGDAQRNAIITECYPFLVYVAKCICKELPIEIERSDLISFGAIGLIDAIKKFNPARGMKFKSFASLRVKGAIIDGLRSCALHSRDAVEKNKSLLNTEEKLRQELHREPAPYEVIEEMKIKPKHFNRHLRRMDNRSLDSPIGINRAPFSDIVADLRPDTTSLKMEFEDVWKMVEKCMPERDQQILKSIYFDGKMLKNIAKEMGLLSGTTICKCHADAIDHLRYIFRMDREAA